MANRYPRIKIDRRARDLEAYGPVYTCTQCGLRYHSFEQRTVCVECTEKQETATSIEPMQQQETDEQFVTNMDAALEHVSRRCFTEEALLRYDTLKAEQETLV